MATILDEHDPQTETDQTVSRQYVDADGHANVTLLQDRMPAWMQATSSTTALAAALGLLFLVLNFQPLWHTDVWGHLAYGRWIIQNGTVPSTEPLMPLAKGVPFIDTAWLSQVIGFEVMSLGNVEALQFLVACCVVAAAGLIAFSVLHRTASLSSSLLSLALLTWMLFQQTLVARPQAAGMLCFALVFTMATSVRWRSSYRWAIPLVFAAWANLHGSFIMGLLLLGALLVGRGVDVFRRSRSWKMVISERGTRELFLALELSAVAVLLNPYGLAVYGEVFAVASNPNLASLLEWEPLTLRMKQGQAVAATVLALICLYRLSPRRVTCREGLLLGGLGIAMLWHGRMIVWWAPVAAYYVGLHFAATWRKWHPRKETYVRRGGLWTVCTLGLLWIFVAYSPLGMILLHGRPQDPAVAAAQLRHRLSPLTPLGATEYLNENPPTGQVFNTYEYGDYLLWAGPENLQVFLDSHAHLVPTEVWDDYLQITRGNGDWRDTLDRYGVNAIVIDRARLTGLIEYLERQTEDWDKKYADNHSAVFYRKQPI